MADEQQFTQPSKISPSEQVVHWTTEVDSLTKLIGGYEVKLETLGENEQQDANKAMADSIGLGYIISGLREDLAAAERELQAASAAFGEPLGAGEDHVSTSPSRTAVSASRNHSALYLLREIILPIRGDSSASEPLPKRKVKTSRMAMAPATRE